MPCLLHVFPSFQPQSPYSSTMAINIQNKIQTIFFLYLSQTPFFPGKYEKVKMSKQVKDCNLQVKPWQAEVWASEGQTQGPASGSAYDINTDWGKKWI